MVVATSCKFSAFPSITAPRASALQQRRWAGHTRPDSLLNNLFLLRLASRGKEPDPHFVSLSAGLTAGSAAAIVSQPADVLLTRLCGTTATTQLVECVIASGLWQQVGGGGGSDGSFSSKGRLDWKGYCVKAASGRDNSFPSSLVWPPATPECVRPQRQ